MEQRFLRRLMGVFILLVLVLACDKSEMPVPNVHFEVYVDLTLPQFNKQMFIFNSDGRQKAGVAGVIVYQNTLDSYYVYERYCPYDGDSGGVVDLDESRSAAVCSTCGSQFLLGTSEGGVLEGPATYSLKTYTSRREGKYLIISN
ncbi:Rieske (2Fe-2S) protein [Geofilum sp. OHC36d9]|uniref:Rieske (2Fe-2S) protein n=1 Tax=Geofilum sp. OHC36d9 TaxID=3458413 RepID=UPI004034404B